MVGVQFTLQETGKDELPKTSLDTDKLLGNVIAGADIEDPGWRI
jgi:hypothetical protein